MSEMQERDIAEILGWDRNEGPDYTYWTRPGKVDGSPPTVDDLARWLLSQGWLLSEIWLDPVTVHEPAEGYDCYFKRFRPLGAAGEFFNACTPTLLDAFEEAVRHVAEAEIASR